jgi:hypothetical protein
MAKNKSVLLILGAAGAVYFAIQALRYRQVANKLSYTLGNVSFSGTIVNVTINVLNPTGVSATLKSIVGDVVSSGGSVATVQYFGKTIIRANSSTAITVQLVPRAIGVASLLYSLISYGGKPNFKLVGSANINNINIPITITA